MKKKMLLLPLIMGAGVALSVSTSSSAQFSNMNLPWTSWNGVYFGTYFGAGSGRAHENFHDRDKFTSSFFEDNSITSANVGFEKGSGRLHGDITGSKADLFVGYNFNPPCANYVLSAQLEGTYFSDIALKTTGQRQSITHETSGDVEDGTLFVDTSTVDTENATSERVDELRSMFSLVGRAGYLVAPPFLVYVLGGGTEGHFVIPDSFDPTGSRRNKWQPGYTFGAGIEYMFTCHWFLRAEYRRLHFNVERNNGDTSRTTQVFGGFLNIFTGNFNRRGSTDFDFNLGQIGIVYRF